MTVEHKCDLFSYSHRAIGGNTSDKRLSKVITEN